METTPVFDHNKCTLCGRCIEVCPKKILHVEDGRVLLRGDCLLCGHCYSVCRFDSVTIDSLSFPRFRTLGYSGEKYRPDGTDPDFLAKIICTRRSIRKYREDVPEKKVIEDLIAFGSCAPSGSNYQAWEFTVLEKRETISEVRRGVIGFYAKIQKLAGNPVIRALSPLFLGRALVNYYVNRYDRMKLFLSDYENGIDPLFYGAPVIIIVHSSMEGSTPVEDAQFASYNISLMAHAMGLGTCFIGYATEAFNRVRDLKLSAGIPPTNRVHDVITLGFPGLKYERAAPRKPVNPVFL